MDGIDRTTRAPLTGKTGETGSIISQCLGRMGPCRERPPDCLCLQRLKPHVKLWAWFGDHPSPVSR